MEFIVRTKMNNIFRSISFNETEVESIGDNKERFMNSVIKKGKFTIEIHKPKSLYKFVYFAIFLALIAHNVQSESIVAVDLVDEYGMPIDDDNIFLIKQFKNCSHFFIEIRSKYRQNDIDTLIEVSICFEVTFSHCFLLFALNLTNFH